MLIQFELVVLLANKIRELSKLIHHFTACLEFSIIKWGGGIKQESRFILIWLKKQAMKEKRQST